jgi:hypothetical protein
VTEGIRVVRGDPTDDELAALVGALLILPAQTGVTVEPVSRWARSARPQAFRRGPDGWRASGLPVPR